MEQCTITYDGNTINLQADGYAVLDGYYPNAPTGEAETVVDTLDVLVRGTSPSNLDLKVRALARALQFARNHKTDGRACYINYAPDASAALARSRVFDGAVVYDAGLTRRRKDNKARVTITIERQPFWEEAQVQLQLTNLNGTNNTSGLTVFNCADESGTSPNKRCNYVEIAAASVAGDLPAPVRLELTNTFNNASQLGLIWVGHGTQETANLVLRLEAESAEGKSGTSNSSCSGGKYQNVSIPQSTATEAYIWTLTAAQLGAAAGGWFHVLPKTHTVDPRSFRLQLKLKYSDYVIWQSGWVAAIDGYALNVRDVFKLRLPPWLDGMGSYAELKIVLEVMQTLQASYTYDLDVLYLIPADQWLFLDRGFVQLPYNSRVVIDGIESVTYRDDGSGAGRVALPKPAGTVPLLVPGKTQRLYFLTHSWSMTTGEITRTMSVKAYYRPRRATV